MTEHAIVAEDLLKRYGKVTALRDTSFAVTKGTITGFVGRNGARPSARTDDLGEQQAAGNCHE